MRTIKVPLRVGGVDTTSLRGVLKHRGETWVELFRRLTSSDRLRESDGLGFLFSPREGCSAMLDSGATHAKAASQPNCALDVSWWRVMQSVAVSPGGAEELGRQHCRDR